MKLGRRDFLKWSAVAGTAAAIGAGATAALWPTAANTTPRIDAWRARPGMPLPLLLEEDVPEGEQRAQSVEVQLVEVDASGNPLRLLATVPLVAQSLGHWTGQAPAPEAASDKAESYLLTAVFVDARGRIAMSKPAEIVSLPIHAGF